MKIPITLQLAVLTVLLTGFYMMVGQSVPQKEVHPPEVIEIAEDVTTEEMVAIGRGIYEGKGICFTCHANTSRYPDLNNISSVAATRKAGLTAVDYLAESLYDPGAYIVEGFNPGMPEINKPPIGLTDPEILSVIAYLQTLGGEATVTMDTRTAYTGGDVGGDEAAADGAAAAAGGTVLDAYGCGRCHDAEQPEDPKSPSLKGIGDRLSADQLLSKLYYHEGDDGLDQVTMTELESMVQFLTEQRGEQG
ncbi:MAG: cytochrome c [bacterium]|nr:cytochrome c [bacterium]